MLTERGRSESHTIANHLAISLYQTHKYIDISFGMFSLFKCKLNNIVLFFNQTTTKKKNHDFNEQLLKEIDLNSFN